MSLTFDTLFWLLTIGNFVVIYILYSLNYNNATELRQIKEEYKKLNEAAIKCCHDLVEDFFRDKGKAKVWWKTYNPLLCSTPNQLVDCGKTYKVLKFIVNSALSNDNIGRVKHLEKELAKYKKE